MTLQMKSCMSKIRMKWNYECLTAAGDDNVQIKEMGLFDL